jgi:hypothetical protein
LNKKNSAFSQMEATSKYFVYALVDPRTDIVMYVGATKDPKTRLSLHISALKSASSKKRGWIESLTSCGLMPIMRLLEGFDTAAEAAAGESDLYAIYDNGQLVCQNPQKRRYHPSGGDGIKVRTSFALSQKTIDALKVLAEADNRSQAQMLEVLVARAHEQQPQAA